MELIIVPINNHENMLIFIACNNIVHSCMLRSKNTTKQSNKISMQKKEKSSDNLLRNAYDLDGYANSKCVYTLAVRRRKK